MPKELYPIFDAAAEIAQTEEKTGVDLKALRGTLRRELKSASKANKEERLEADQAE